MPRASEDLAGELSLTALKIFPSQNKNISKSLWGEMLVLQLQRRLVACSSYAPCDSQQQW